MPSHPVHGRPAEAYRRRVRQQAAELRGLTGELRRAELSRRAAQRSRARADDPRPGVSDERRRRRSLMRVV